MFKSKLLAGVVGLLGACGTASAQYPPPYYPPPSVPVYVTPNTPIAVDPLTGSEDGLAILRSVTKVPEPVA